jgi:hypothetical protein
MEAGIDRTHESTVEGFVSGIVVINWIPAFAGMTRKK